jgi:uncharacterized protein (TIGR02246 family)
MSDENGRAADEAAVGEVLIAIGASFRTLDTGGLDQVYAQDADWTNAFGTSRHGRTAIIEYLSELFADPRFAAGKPVAPPQASIRFVADDVAVAKTYIEREGQQTVDGSELPVRRNHSLKVLVNRDRRWQIVSELYMDARDETTHEHQDN